MCRDGSYLSHEWCGTSFSQASCPSYALSVEASLHTFCPFSNRIVCFCCVLFFFLSWVLSYLYILDGSSWSDTCCACTFLESVACLFLLVTGSFTEQKFIFIPESPIYPCFLCQIMFLLSYLRRPLLRGAPESQRFSPALPPKNSVVLCLTSQSTILSEFLHQVWNWGQDSHVGLRMSSTIGWKDHWSLIESLLNLCQNKLTVLVCECTGTIFGFSVLFHWSVSLSLRNITQYGYLISLGSE